MAKLDNFEDFLKMVNKNATKDEDDDDDEDIDSELAKLEENVKKEAKEKERKEQEEKIKQQKQQQIQQQVQNQKNPQIQQNIYGNNTGNMGKAPQFNQQNMNQNNSHTQIKYPQTNNQYYPQRNQPQHNQSPYNQLPYNYSQHNHPPYNQSPYNYSQHNQPPYNQQNQPNTNQQKYNQYSNLYENLLNIQTNNPPNNQKPNTNTPPQYSQTQPPKQYPQNHNNDQDIYNIDTENIYHNIKFFKSVSVLEEEQKKCDEIIKYKKEKNKPNDIQYWQSKQKAIESQITNITNLIQTDKITVETYKKVIQQSLTYEQGFLNKLLTDKKLSPSEIPEIKLRINKRISLIQSELKEEITEDESEESTQQIKESKPETKLSPLHNEPPKHSQPTTSSTQPENKTEQDTTTKTTTNVTQSQKEQQITSLDTKNNQPSKETKTTQDTTSKENNPQTQNEQTTISPQNEKPTKPNINNETLNILNSRLNEYKSASNYFQQNQFNLQQQKDSLNKIKTLQSLIQKAEKGENISPNTIPPQLTPEYLFGYSHDEKVSRYKQILQEKIKQRNVLSEELKAVESNLTKIPKNQIKRVEQQIRKEITSKQTELNALMKEINNLKELASSQWTPVPLFNTIEKSIKKEMINENIPPNTLNIFVGKTTYDKDKVFLDVKISYSGKVQNEKVTFTEMQTFDKNISFNFEKNEFKALFRNNIDIKVYRRKGLRDVVKGNATVSLAGLKNKNIINTNAEIELESGRFKPTVEIKVEVRTPCLEPMYGVVKKSCLEVQKIYPEFNISRSNIPQIQNNNENSNSNVKESNKEKKEVTNVTTSDVKLSKEEIENPDILDNLNTIMVLENKIKECNEKIAKIEGRIPKDLKHFLLRIKIKKQDLEDKLGSEISPQDYYNGINHQLQHDKALYLHFKEKNLTAKAETVKQRISILLKEKKETETLLNSSE